MWDLPELACLSGLPGTIDKLALALYNIDGKLPAIDQLGGELHKIVIISRLDRI